MENQLPKDITYKKVAWRIRDFSQLNVLRMYSDVFIIGGCAWRILIFPNGNNVDFLSLYLDVAEAKSLPKEWSINADYSMTVVNQIRIDDSVKRGCTHNFDASAPDWGYTSFIPLNTFKDLVNGYILNDSCIIEVEISVLETQQIITKVPTKPIEELADFKGLANVEKAYIPLLEEVCSWHPSLVECQKKRTHTFKDWAFTALGRVLEFLKTKKVKDMITNEEDCEKLENLWEELEMCRFDLTWLEPHVKSALGMKAYVEKAEKLKKLRDMVKDMEMEMDKLREQLAAIEENFEQASKDLTEAEIGFEEKNVDPEQELGYGEPLPCSSPPLF